MSSGEIDYGGALEAVERILNRGGDAEDVLRGVLDAFDARGISFARVQLAGGDGLEVGERRVSIAAPVSYEGSEIGSLEVAADDRAFVERVATLISHYVARLETGGDAASPLPERSGGSTNPAESAQHFSRLRRSLATPTWRTSRLRRGVRLITDCNARPFARSKTGLGARRAPAAVLEAAGATALALTSPRSCCKWDRPSALSLVPGTPHIRGTIPHSRGSRPARPNRDISAANTTHFRR